MEQRQWHRPFVERVGPLQKPSYKRIPSVCVCVRARVSNERINNVIDVRFDDDGRGFLVVMGAREGASSTERQVGDEGDAIGH